MTRAARRLAGVLLMILLTVMIGGVSVLTLLIASRSTNPPGARCSTSSRHLSGPP
jgi:hypothetical protein